MLNLSASPRRTAQGWSSRSSPQSRSSLGSCSMAFHLRGPLLAEGPHAFSVIARASRAVLQIGLVLEELVESARHARVESLLAERERLGRAASKRLCELAPFRRELGVGPDMRHEPDAQRFVRGDRFAGQDHVEGAAPTDHPWKEECRARVRHKTEE